MSNSSGPPLRGSAHYIWNLSDVLGQGATGAVYKARHKNTGELYAVKTFNQISYMRPYDVQKREFDVLQRLNHENIVRLLAIEEETGTRSQILVMELCTAGSLYNLLEQPENAFGLEEKEFLCVLNDVACGMKHLHDQGIVHRDIKPGNIMRYINDDGRSIYKLIDFGAARELQNEEQFLSLYGTEEYLFPDMYERAVLRRPNGKQFGAMVDLWSVGVTLYHVATGQLPFRSYGGRKDQATMHKITTEKALGVISGIQNKADGPIEWSRQLPDSCRLSRGLKKQLIPLLAGLCECKEERMITFDDYFECVKMIVNKHVVYVYSYRNVELLHIYINKDEQLTQFQESIAEQSDIRAQGQRLLFENHDFEKIVKPIQPVSQYPTTSSQNPIYLFSDSNEISASAIKAYEIQVPTVPSEVVVDVDLQTARSCCAAIHYIRRVTAEDILKQQLITKSAKMYLLFLGQEIDHAKDLVIESASLIEETGKRIELVRQNTSVMINLIESLAKAKGKTYSTLPKAFQTESIFRQIDSFKKCSEQIKTLKKVTEELCATINLERISWLESPGCKDTDRCIPKSDCLVGAVQQVVADFDRDKKLKNLSFNEQQIHKFDKHKLKVNCTKALSLLQEHCNPNTKKVFDIFSHWYCKMWEIQKKLGWVKREVEAVCEKQLLIADNLDQAQEERQKSLNQLLPDIGCELSVNYAPNKDYLISNVTNNEFNFVVPHGRRPKPKESVKQMVQVLRGGVLEGAVIQSSIEEIMKENTNMLEQMLKLGISQTGQLVNAAHAYNDTEPETLKNI